MQDSILTVRESFGGKDNNELSSGISLFEAERLMAIGSLDEPGSGRALDEKYYGHRQP